MTTPKDNTEIVRMLRDVKDSIWKSVTPMKDIGKDFPDYISGLTRCPGSSSRIMPDVAARLNFSTIEDSILPGESSFMRSFQTPGCITYIKTNALYICIYTYSSRNKI